MLYGRDATISGAVACIEQRALRHLVFTGRTGVGRTAVATAVAERLQRPSVTVDAAGATGEREVLVRLARALGVTDAGRRIESVAAARLGEQPTVAVVDDVEDWGPVAPVVDRLLDRCDDLVVVSTARTPPAGAVPETVIHLHPLVVPAPYGWSPTALGENPAVRLFVTRAQRTLPTFDPDEHDLRAIAELCRRLDGLPLAISLAASRIALMRPEAMLRQVSRTDPWDLVGLSLDDELVRSAAELDDAAARVLRALEVFVGGASIDSVHDVVGLPSLDETIGALSRLVELDLVTVDRERARYAVSSAVSSFVRDAPGFRGAEPELRQRHAQHFRAHAREQIDSRPDPDLAIDHGNRLAAVEWLQRAGRHDDALRLVVDVAADFDRRGEPDVGRLSLLSALAGASGQDPRTEAEAHLWVARFVAEAPDPADRRLAIEHQLTARARAESSGHEPTVLAVLLAICESHTLLGAHDLASAAVADGLARTSGGRHPVAEVGFLTWQAVLVHQAGDGRRAAEVVAEAIGKAVALGDRRLIVRSCLVYLGLPSDVRAEVTTESPSPRALVEMARAEGDVRGEGWILALVTGNAVDDGDLAQATAAAHDLLVHARDRSNAALGRLALAATVRIAAEVGAERLAARVVGALDRHGPAIQASIAPHSYASYRVAVASVEEALGGAWEVLHERGRLADWEALLDEVDSFLLRQLEGTVFGSGTLRDRLTPRELEVLGELVRGRTNKEIATILGMRPKTVMHHCAAIYRKLEVQGRAGAVGVAAREGFRP